MLATLVIEASRFEAPARALDASTVVDHRTHACAPGCRFLTLVTPALGTENTVGIDGPRHAPPVLASGGALQLLGDGRAANTILEERNASSADISRCGSSAQRPRTICVRRCPKGGHICRSS
jgi:hypothetical protein